MIQLNFNRENIQSNDLLDQLMRKFFTGKFSARFAHLHIFASDW